MKQFKKVCGVNNSGCWYHFFGTAAFAEWFGVPLSSVGGLVDEYVMKRINSHEKPDPDRIWQNEGGVVFYAVMNQYYCGDDAEARCPASDGAPIMNFPCVRDRALGAAVCAVICLLAFSGRSLAGEAPSGKPEHWLLLQGDMRGPRDSPNAIRDILEAALDEVAQTAESRGIRYELETVDSLHDFNRALARPGVTSVFFAGHGTKGCLVDHEGGLICPEDVDAPSAKAIEFYTVACEAGQGDWDTVFASAEGNFMMNFAPGISFFRSLQPIHSANRKMLDPFHIRINQATISVVEAVHFAEQPKDRRQIGEYDLQRMAAACETALNGLAVIRKDLLEVDCPDHDARLSRDALVAKTDKWTKRIAAAREAILSLLSVKPQAGEKTLPPTKKP